MEPEIIDDWVKVFESPDIIEAELVEAMFRDANIEFMNANKSNIGYSVYVGPILTDNFGSPVKLFVHTMDEGKALGLISEDKSKIMDNPEINFGDIEDYEKADDEVDRETK